MLTRISKMDGMKYVALAVTTCLFLASECAGLCHDLDPLACQTMTSQNQHFCRDSPLASTVCPKFCKKCPLVCYHCDNTVYNYTDCTSTRECQVGEQCLLHQLVSSKDGHREYKMNCASPDICDGTGFLQTGRRHINRRNLITQCCTVDLCNNPGYYQTTTLNQTTALKQTTTPSKQTTSSTATSTKTPLSLTSLNASNCNKDILFLIEDSTDIMSTFYIRNYLTNIVSNLPIGVDHTMVGVALYESNVDSIIDLGHHPNKTELLHFIRGILFEHDSNEIDKGDVMNFIHHKFNSPGRHGDRANFENVVVIIEDHFSRLLTARFLSNDGPNSSMSSLSKDVIVINVGAEGRHSKFSSVASDANHVIDVHSYPVLSTTLKSVLNLICA